MKKILLVSCSIILTCMCTVAAVYVSLILNDTEQAKNHLVSGNLDLALTRTNLEYCVLDEKGELCVKTASDDYDFTSPTSESVFGMASKNIKIVPGSYFDADMQIANIGNVKFTYDVKIVLSGESNSLAEQLQVTVVHPQGEAKKMLSELTEGETLFTGTMHVSEDTQAFSVRIDFLEDENNSSAMGQSAVFDLVVTATQWTK